MRVVVQRVQRAAVRVDGRTIGEIGQGLLVYVAVAGGEGTSAAAAAAGKLWHLRLFPGEDTAGVGDRSAADLDLPVLVVSQFTLYADVSRGRRPYYGAAAPPDEAVAAVAALCSALRELGAHVEEGEFGAHMDVESVNDGPVTLVLDI